MIEGLMLSIFVPGTAFSIAARTWASPATAAGDLATAAGRADAEGFAAFAGPEEWLCAQAEATVRARAMAAVWRSERFIRLPRVGYGHSDRGHAGKVQHLCHARRPASRR